MAINEDIPGISDLFETMKAGTNQAPLGESPISRFNPDIIHPG
jgi:hypothetical protein